MSIKKNTVPVITSVKNSQGEEIPNGGITSSTVVPLSGLAPAGDELQILDGATVMGQVVADAAGTWHFHLMDLSVSTHSIRARGQAGVSAPRTFIVTVA
ncbi:hypothetical protein ACIP8I_11085 [Pseudomonas sp. NPDC088414]|uniref:hypothetical protein n=1 Tax=Pseudomonas sp. NPDC088414 TaxID=3364454 RepID=UPI0038100C84